MTTNKNNVESCAKEELSRKLKEIAGMGWIPNARGGNYGGAGNTLEDLLGIKENNRSTPDFGKWEIKTGLVGSSSLVTLFHFEPSPRALKMVPQILLPLYGWEHKDSGGKYPKNEMSFRATIRNQSRSNRGQSRSNRGFMVLVDRKEKKVLVSFDAKSVDVPQHKAWLASVKERVGLGEIDPQPCWSFSDLEHAAGTKLRNMFYAKAEAKKVRGKEYYRYIKITMFQNFIFSGFLKALEEGKILVDFDARTGHNHGTKFRAQPDALPMLYEKQETIHEAA